jgi:hypothetical protein
MADDATLMDLVSFQFVGNKKQTVSGGTYKPLTDCDLTEHLGAGQQHLHLLLKRSPVRHKAQHSLILHPGQGHCPEP